MIPKLILLSDCPLWRCVAPNFDNPYITQELEIKIKLLHQKKKNKRVKNYATDIKFHLNILNSKFGSISPQYKSENINKVFVKLAKILGIYSPFLIP
jgi:hypothetical protein